eukprot:Gb_26737 [translate_table: standard]
MAVPCSSFSPIFLHQRDVEEQFQVGTLFDSNPSVSAHPPEAPGIHIDDPFPLINPQYIMCKSYCHVPDLSASQCYSSLGHPQNDLVGSYCGRQGLNSGYLVRSSEPTRIPAGHRRWIQAGACNSRKNVRKVIERKRRNDMKALYSVLRSLIPEESIKGKRSLSDQIQEAINYIHHLLKRVKELGQKRDEMRISDNIKISVRIKVNTFKDLFVFSDLLLALEEHGLEVVTAVATEVNDKVFLTIHSKVSTPHRFECRALYNKLWALMGKRVQDAYALEDL